MISNKLLNLDCNYDFIAKKAEMHGIFTAKVKDEFPSASWPREFQEHNYITDYKIKKFDT